MMSAATMTAKATGSTSEYFLAVASVAGSTLCNMSGPPSEQAGGPDQQHDRHDDEDHRAGGLGKENLGQPFDDTEPKTGEDRAHDRAHAADHHHCEHHDDEVGAHLRAHVVDRRR